MRSDVPPRRIQSRTSSSCAISPLASSKSPTLRITRRFTCNAGGAPLRDHLDHHALAAQSAGLVGRLGGEWLDPKTEHVGSRGRVAPDLGRGPDHARDRR